MLTLSIAKSRGKIVNNIHKRHTNRAHVYKCYDMSKLCTKRKGKKEKES